MLIIFSSENRSFIVIQKLQTFYYFNLHILRIIKLQLYKTCSFFYVLNQILFIIRFKIPTVDTFFFYQILYSYA